MARQKQESERAHGKPRRGRKLRGCLITIAVLVALVALGVQFGLISYTPAPREEIKIDEPFEDNDIEYTIQGISIMDDYPMLIDGKRVFGFLVHAKATKDDASPQMEYETLYDPSGKSLDPAAIADTYPQMFNVAKQLKKDASVDYWIAFAYPYEDGEYELDVSYSASNDKGKMKFTVKDGGTKIVAPGKDGDVTFVQNDDGTWSPQN